MKIFLTLLLMVFAVHAHSPSAEEPFDTDIIHTSAGDLAITFIGHASYMIAFDGTVIHVDPWSEMADYANLPKADILLITHTHPDHFDRSAYGHILTDNTSIIYTLSGSETLPGGVVTRHGDVLTARGLNFECVHAYNLTNMRGGERLVHPKGFGNGYIITFGDKRVYVAGETELTDEVKEIEDIDVAFISMDSVYNLTPEMADELVRIIKPEILYPIHFADADPSELEELLKDIPEIEVRIRKMK